MRRAPPFATLALGPAAHFKLVLFGTLLRLIELHPPEDRVRLLEALPFLEAYRDECATLWGSEAPDSASWFGAVDDWARERPQMPFGRLAASGFPTLHCQLLATLALVDEDPRFAYMIEPEGGVPTLGGLIALWREAAPQREGAAIRDALLDMAAAGLVDVSNLEAMRTDWRLRLPTPLLETLGGGVPRIEGAAFEPNAALPGTDDWLGEADPALLGGLLSRDPACMVLIRGPRNNGRKMLLRFAAGRAGMNVLAVPIALFADPARWRVAGAAALAANAMILAELEPAPGETFDLPAHPAFTGPVGIAIGASGGVRAPPAMRTIAVPLGLPDAPARRAHWRRTGLGELAETLATMTMTTGNIDRAAAGAASRASLAGRSAPEAGDVRAALRDLRDSRLDALATPIDLAGPPEPLHLEERDRDELDALLLRCRHRERLGGMADGPGVCALFAGPSGTGKTLAARHIAAALDKDLYRIDLAATVSKYIGETEKSLERALSAAEELNIVLLLDEGDALMARRTDVSSSNDRYANLETNFLLQRIDSFTGIILVTSNDSERIDPSFARRMDAVLTFRMPDEIRKHDILIQQLGEQAVSARLLQDIACRCALSGGQIHNIAVHARLLAMDSGSPVGDLELRQAVVREYRKTGDYCPLKLPLAAVG
jgi:hypothetical protein